jgi:CHRD domain-containing protein
MHTRDMKRWTVLAWATAGLLMAGCGNDTYVATTQLAGGNEAPTPVSTSATGVATATLDGDELSVTGTFSGLDSPLHEVSGSAAHVHIGDVGVAGDIVFNLTTTTTGTDSRTGSFAGKMDLNDDQQTAFKSGRLYVNVHSENHPMGEIRGQFVPVKK